MTAKASIDSDAASDGDASNNIVGNHVVSCMVV